MIPLLGPTTLRDLTGSAGDGLARGFYTPWNDDFTTMTVVYAGQTVNGVSLHLGQYQEMKAMSLDPYVAFRNGYAQLRHTKSAKTGNAAEFPAVQPPAFAASPAASGATRISSPLASPSDPRASSLRRNSRVRARNSPTQIGRASCRERV